MKTRPIHQIAAAAVAMLTLGIANAAPEPVDDRARAKLKTESRERMRQDRRNYDREELGKIEKLYQIANTNWRKDREKAKLALENLVAKYEKANRTGCAMLYLGQLSRGEERAKYLDTAIEEFSDCFYGDGVQVGGFARYLRILDLRAEGEDDAADKLEKELRKKYRKSISHTGYLITELLDAQ